MLAETGSLDLKKAEVYLYSLDPHGGNPPTPTPNNRNRNLDLDFGSAAAPKFF